jgi:hypothetical protein
VCSNEGYKKLNRNNSHFYNYVCKLWLLVYYSDLFQDSVVPKDILKNDQLRIHLYKYNRVASCCSWFDSLILVASLFIRFGKKKEELIYKKTN